MKEWNELDIEKLEKNEIKNINDNELDNALVVISNLIARATTKWTLEETKLFLCSVSQIRTRDSDCFVKLSKRDIIEKLNVDRHKITKLREMFKRVATKSYIQINGKNDDEWDDGFLIRRIKSDKKNVYVQFDDHYVPLLDELSSHFTDFYLDYVKDFTKLSTYKLYVYLCSWHDPNYLIQNKKIKKSELHEVFNLKPSDYWRNYGKENEKFDWGDFERYVLKPAIEEINQLNREHKCDMCIESCDKIKKGKFVLGYDIRYSFTDDEGFRK